MTRGGIFINYRGDDSHTTAELIDRDLADEFGRERVFLDCRSISIGDDYVRELVEQVRRCRVLLVLIGPTWLTLTTPTGVRRIDEPTDWIRREIAEAFDAGVRVVPVLLDDTPRLAQRDLPADISALAHLQAVVVRRRHTRADIRDLIRRLSEVEPALAAARDEARTSEENTPSADRLPGMAKGKKLFFVLLGIGLVVFVGAIAIKLWSQGTSQVEPTSGRGGPGMTDGGLPPPVVTSPSPQQQTINSPCLLIMPNLIQQTYGLPPLHIEERGFSPVVGGNLPGSARMVHDLTCSIDLAGSAGRLEVRLVDLGDQPGAKAVFEQFGQTVVRDGEPLSTVSNCGDECRQAPGRFVARKGNRVLLFLDVPSDIAVTRSPSLEFIARTAVSMA